MTRTEMLAALLAKIPESQLEVLFAVAIGVQLRDLSPPVKEGA